MRSAWFWVGVALLFRVAEAADTRLVPPIVRSIEVRTVGRPLKDTGFVRSRISVAENAPFNPAAASRDVKELMESGMFSDVTVGLEETEGGAKVVYLVRPRVRLADDVRFQGLKSIREAKARDLIGLRPGDYVDDLVMGQRVLALAGELRKRCLVDAKISWQIEEIVPEDGLARVTVRVEEGRRAPVRSVSFSGNRAVPESVLRRAMKQPAKWNPFWWLRKKTYDDDEFETARLDIRDLYLDRGYLDAEVSPPRVMRERHGGLLVNVEIKEGEQYRIGGVSVEGASLFAPEDLLKVCGLREGAEASLRAIERAAGAIADYYESRGYLGTSVRPVIDSRPADRVVDIRFAVREGILTRIRNIIIQGNSRTRDKVIRRELVVEPGDLYDSEKIRRSERIVKNLGFFSTVRSFPLDTAVPDEKDLVFQLEETRTGSIMLGVGFSSIDKTMGYVDISQGNFDLFGWPYFTGGGQKLKLHTQFGSRRREYELTFVEPWFMDRKLSVGVDLYRREVEYTDYESKRTGVSVFGAKAMPFGSRLDLRYRIEKLNLGNLSDTNLYHFADSPDEEYRFSDEKRDATESSLTATLSRDMRDNPFVPTRGSRASIYGTIMGGPLGFDTDLYRLGFQGSCYFPLWFGHVLGARTRWEVVDAMGDSTLSIDNRLFAGGGRTIRGFRYRDVGPKVVRTEWSKLGNWTEHKPVGGQSLAVATIEYSVPLFPNVRIAAFCDAGNVWREPYDFDFNSIAVGAGGGLRLDIPGFPVRIDYAVPVQKDSDLTRKDAWTFWIGYEY